MNADLTQSETDPRKPTTFQLLGDAVSYARSNFTTFLLFGGGLIVVPKLIYVIVPWVRNDPEVIGLGALAWPVYFLTIFLKAIFAYNVHRFVLLRQRRVSFALNKTFWLFFAAVLAIQLAFLIPGELLESFFSVERIIGWRRSQLPFPISPPLWFLLPPLSHDVGEFLVFVLIARFLIIPPSIIARGKIAVSANLKIVRKLYWQIFWGLLILHLFLSLYSFAVGIGLGSVLERFVDLEDDRFSLISLTLTRVFLAPISFFYVLLGATFTSAVLIRGSHYLGLPDPVRSNNS